MFGWREEVAEVRSVPAVAATNDCGIGFASPAVQGA